LTKLGLNEILSEEIAWLDGVEAGNDEPKASGSGGSSDRLEFMSQFQSNANMQKLSSILKNIKQNRDKTACEVVDHQKQPAVRARAPKKPKKTNPAVVKGPFSSSSSSEDEGGDAAPEVNNGTEIDGTKTTQQRKRIMVIESSSSENEDQQLDDILAPKPGVNLKKFAFDKQAPKQMASTSKSNNFFNLPQKSIFKPAPKGSQNKIPTVPSLEQGKCKNNIFI